MKKYTSEELETLANKFHTEGDENLGALVLALSTVRGIGENIKSDSCEESMFGILVDYLKEVNTAFEYAIKYAIKYGEYLENGGKE